MKKAIFISSDYNYLPYLNTLLNSFHKRKLGKEFDVYIIHHDFRKLDYLKRAQKEFDFRVIPIKVDEKDFPKDSSKNKNLFIKQSRFHYIRKYGLEYDVICLLDADMFLLSENFDNLFQLVHNTNKLIGCNERFKWTFGPHYLHNDKPIFKEEFRAFKFHCSVPIIFDLKKWLDVFDYYNELAFNASEKRKDGSLKTLGDMYCWNTSVYKNNRQNDIILFPMETMTQVHQTGIMNPTRLMEKDGYWQTWNGDEVFTFHGRIRNKDEWREKQLEYFENKSADYKPIVKLRKRKDTEGTINKILKEWEELSFKSKIDVREYL